MAVVQRWLDRRSALEDQAAGREEAKIMLVHAKCKLFVVNVCILD
jgi:hypothetical protein